MSEMVAEMSLDKEKAMTVGSQGSYYLYPKPVAKYEDIVGNPKLFMDTLEKLHAAMGTKFMIPTIGGRELDLHRLFVEVTSRGGVEKIINEKRWREVIAEFNFPPTATNASFILRKHYMSLVYHYEQIYFHQSERCISPLNASLTALTVPSVKSSGPSIACSHNQFSAYKRKKTSDDSSPSDLPLAKNSHVFGIINGKCEHGYLVTVTIGPTKLQGLLYHPAEQNALLASQIPDIVSNSTSMVGRRRRRKKKLSKRDPTHPKPNRSGYNFFFSEQHARLKQLHPGKDREISKTIGELWNNLTEMEKAVYQEKGVKDKERYRSEMEAYKQRRSIDQIISAAAFIQKGPAESEPFMREVVPKMDKDEDYLDESTVGSTDFDENNSGTDSEAESQEAAEKAPGSANLLAYPSNVGDT